MAILSIPAEFTDVLQSSVVPAARPPFRTLGELLLRAPYSGETPLVLGTDEQRALTVTARDLRRVAVSLSPKFEALGVVRGRTAALIRLPGTSETLVAATFAALTAAGIRVLLPMVTDPRELESWLVQADVSAVFWSQREVARHASEATRRQFGALEAVVEAAGIPAYCLCGDLDVPGLLTSDGPEPSEIELARLAQASNPDDECVVLTTSGTSGTSRLVCYDHRAILMGCAAWERAGLFASDAMGGRALCLLFAHSMGVRSFWNAVWTGHPLCLVSPEWFGTHPDRVRVRLSEMRPQHVSGGPGVYRTLLEFARIYPDLQTTALADLRSAVSIGAAFDPDLARRVEHALGQPLQNGFGMTETMQVTSTVLSTDTPADGHLGAPLPGVRLGLAPREDLPEGVYALWVSSPFGACRVLNGAAARLPEWLETGDLVEKTDDGLRYFGRASTDFFKDSFGLKIPRRKIDGLYLDLSSEVEHLEVMPLRDEPGLAAIAFLGRRAGHSAGSVVTGDASRRLEARFDGRHDRLHDELEETNFRHMTVARFACVAATAPRTAKGNVRRGLLRRSFGALITRLTGPEARGQGIVHLDRDRFTRSAFTRTTHPRRGILLELAGLSKAYVSGEGDRLVYCDRGQNREVIDLVGGFGANLLGHRHPEVIAAATEFITGPAVSLLDQGSERVQAAKLGQTLSRMVGRTTGESYVVRFGSTGAEAVEMALAHAHVEYQNRVVQMERALTREFGSRCPELVAGCVARNRRRLAERRPVVLTLDGGFHGHTLGARGLCSGQKHREYLEPLLGGMEVVRLPPDGTLDLDAVLADHQIEFETLELGPEGPRPATTMRSRVFAAFAEPILGEGGIVEVSPDLLKRLSGRDFPLIADEIQAGLGRAGSFVATPGTPDYILFGKALGGGVAKISALLIRRARYVDRFDALYSSTFAADALSCTVASRVLEVIARDDLAARARSTGAHLLSALEALRAEYPHIIRSVRGRGLMLAVELETGIETGEGSSRSPVADSFLLRALAHQDLWGALAAGYLLNAHGVRVLPTLSAPHVLRVEPSAYADEEVIDRLVVALRTFCEITDARALDRLLAFVVRDEIDSAKSSPESTPLPHLESTIEPSRDGIRHVAFVGHFVNPERELAMVEPTLGSMPPGVRRALFHKMEELLELRPQVVCSRRLFGGRVQFTFIALPASVATLEQLHRSADHRVARDRVQDAVDLAASLGAEAIALGAYTSIITSDGGTLAAPPGVRLTTGNALTVAMGARRLRAACAAGGIDPSDPAVRVAVVGAGGNIGSALVHRLLSDKNGFRNAVLVGRGRRKLVEVRAEILAAWEPDLGRPPEIEITTELSSLSEVQAIVVATNANEPLIHPPHLTAGRATVIADLSVPSAVSPEVSDLPGVSIVPLAGAVAVPGEPGFVISTHTKPGTTFCCSAEVMILGLEPELTDGLRLIGRIDPKSVMLMDEIAERHGFVSRLARKNKDGE